jgi:sigma-B regulation protein RsbU (phosphoserine phosphatase)
VRVLIVEDESISRRLLEGLLRQWGHDAVAVTDGDKAWQVLTGDQPPRVAVMDWMMPGIDGLALCRRIRAHDHLRSAYVIVVTGRRTAEDVAAGYAAGADDVLAKPIEHEELRARLRVAARLVALQDELRDLKSR